MGYYHGYNRHENNAESHHNREQLRQEFFVFEIFQQIF